MTLNDATILTKSFTKNSIEYTPALSNDWVFSISWRGNITLVSDLLNISVPLEMYPNYFFNNFIFNKKITFDGNKLIGEFAFSKYTIILKDEFEEAQRLVQDTFPIDNSALSDYAIYIDDKGERFLYLGHFGYKQMNRLFISEKKDKKYIIRYPETELYNPTIIQKTSKRKFIEFVEFLSAEKKESLLRKILGTYTSIFMRDAFNFVEIFKKPLNRHTYTGFIKSDTLFGFFEKYNDIGLLGGAGTKIKFYKLDFDTFEETYLRDMHSGLKPIISNYASVIDDDFSFDNISDFEQLQFFCDYI